MRALRRSSSSSALASTRTFGSIRQAVSETMIIMVDANHACDATATISRPHTQLRGIASANDPMPMSCERSLPFSHAAAKLTRRIDSAAEEEGFEPSVLLRAAGAACAASSW